MVVRLFFKKEEFTLLVQALEGRHRVPLGPMARLWFISRNIFHPLPQRTLRCRKILTAHLVPCLRLEFSRVRNKPSVTPNYGGHGPSSLSGPPMPCPPGLRLRAGTPTLLPCWGKMGVGGTRST